MALLQKHAYISNSMNYQIKRVTGLLFFNKVHILIIICIAFLAFIFRITNITYGQINDKKTEILENESKTTNEEVIKKLPDIPQKKHSTPENQTIVKQEEETENKPSEKIKKEQKKEEREVAEKIPAEEIPKKKNQPGEIKSASSVKKIANQQKQKSASIIKKELKKSVKPTRYHDGLLHISEGDFKYKRIPEYFDDKEDDLKHEVTISSEEEAAINIKNDGSANDVHTTENEEGPFGLSKNITDITVIIFLLIIIIGSIILFKIKSKERAGRVLKRFPGA